MNVSEQKSQKIVKRTWSKTEKYWIAHNFFTFDRNIGMLHLKTIVLMREIQLNKNFWNLSYPVLITTQNDKNLHIFYSNSLELTTLSFLYGHITHEEIYTDEMNVSEQNHRKL